MNIYVYPFALLFYLLSTLYFGLHFLIKRSSLLKIGQIFFLSAFFVHLSFTFLRLYEGKYIPITNLFESLSFFALSIAAFFLYLKIKYGVEHVSFFVASSISFMLILAFRLPNEINPPPPVLKSFWLPIHTTFAFFGNAIFFIAFINSIFYLFLEKRIKEKKIYFAKKPPSLEMIDSINQKCLSIGFPLLTVGIITGSLWASIAWGSFWSWDPKETWSLITWIVYAVVIHQRLRVGWMGRKTAYMMILGFFCILVTFLGVNLILGGLHSYV